MTTTEAFSRVKIDAQLKDAGWAVDDGRSVIFEHVLCGGTRADYVLCSTLGRPLAVLEAKRASVPLGSAEGQAVAYAGLLGVPFVFLANGEEVLFRDLDRDAHFRTTATVFSQDDLERRLATRTLRVPTTSIAIDRRIVERDYQTDCIEALCNGVELGRRKFLVEMATGTGKTRTAAAFMKRLFDAHAVTRALFLVDRDTLAKQAEDAFVEHVPSLPTYRVGGTGQRFKPEKRVTICTLQTMVNEFRHYSAGYFDLIVVDECHRSIYGEFRRVLDHFDAIKVGLTATPLVGRPDADPNEIAFVRDTLRFFEVKEPTFRYTLRQAVEEGHLVPHRIYNARTVRTAAEGGFEVRREEIGWEALPAGVRAELEGAFGAKATIVVDPAALERKFTIPERNRAIVREFRDVLDRGYTGKDGVRRAPDRGKTIVFAVTKHHAETLARMFDEAFADEKPNPTTRIADFVVSGMGAEDTADAPTLIKRFKKEPFPRILVSVNMLDTGFDGPEVVNLVMARFTRSSVLYQQMRGRGTRLAPHIRKTAFTIFDFVGNCAAHEDDEDLAGGVVTETPKQAKPGPPRTLLTLDIHDEIDPTTREWIVWDPGTDGGPTTAEAAEGERLAVRFEAFLGGCTLSAEADRIAGMIAEQFRRDGADMAGFTAGRFTRPPFSLRGGLLAAQAAFGGEAALTAFLARMNAAVFDGRLVGGGTAEARA